MSFFSLTKNERKAVFSFAVFLIFLVGLKWYLKVDNTSTLSVSSSEHQEENNHLNTKRHIVYNSKKQYENKSFAKKQKMYAFPDTTFDPNQLKLNDWMNMGFSVKQSSAIVKYIEKTGGLTSAKELENIYVIPKEQVKALCSKVRIENKVLDLNKISSEELQKLKGIGPVLADRIVKFREKIGGFHSVEQLLDVYGIKAEIVENIKPKLFVQEQNIQKIKINVASYEDLKLCFYLKEKEIKKIISYRTIKPIKQGSELFSLISDSSRVNKLLPYLSYE